MVDPNQEDEQRKGAIWLAFRVFDEPTAVFKELAVRPRALVPLICLVVSGAFTAVAMPSRILEEQTRESLAPVLEREQISEEEVEERVETASGTVGRISIFAATAIGGPVVLVIAAWVLMLVFGATTAEPLRFKEEFAIVAHAYMISIAGGVLSVALVAFAGFDEVKLTLGFLFDEEKNPFLFQFTDQLNLFGAWNVFVLALGNQVKTKAKGVGGPLAIVGGLWLAMKLVGALIGGYVAGLGG